MDSSEPALDAAERAAAAAVAFFLVAAAASVSGSSLRLDLAGLALGSGSGCLRGLPLFRANVCGVPLGVEAGVDAVEDGAVLADWVGSEDVGIGAIGSFRVAVADAVPSDVACGAVVV